MRKQLDIFSGDEPAEAGGRKGSKAPRKKRVGPSRGREVKKAPMIVDSYTPESPVPGRNELPHVHTISEITERIKNHLEGEFVDVWVTGEVTDFRGRKGPHMYFALKDEKSRISAIIFGANGRLPFELVDGQKLICRGRLNVYEPKGAYSLIVDPAHCEPEGIGALKLAFEQLKKKLAAEGLFDPARKRPIPYLPRRIGIVTAPQGAAIRDLIHVLTRRFPNIEIMLHPARVQGDGAAAEIAAAIAAMNLIPDIDVLIVGRGGGSMEDLWCFNEEVVARAIAASRIPVISAVGHEIDFTIADFVADLRAATPSAAAELAVRVRDDLITAIRDSRARLAQGLKRLVERKYLELKRIEGRMADPTRRFPDLIQRVDGLRQRMIYSLNVKAKSLEQNLAKLASNLDHLSPLGVLAKGYAVVCGPDGLAVRDASKLKLGDSLGLRFHKGRASAKVTKIN